MRKLIIAIIGTMFLMVGFATWNVQATTLTGAISAQSPINQPFVQKADCYAKDKCEEGKFQVCKQAG